MCWSEAWERGRSPTDLAERKPKPPRQWAAERLPLVKRWLRFFYYALLQLFIQFSLSHCPTERNIWVKNKQEIVTNTTTNKCTYAKEYA